ncbi:MAG TPA: hypothetical protein VHL53_13115 [Acidimicrobiia bacterium]|nr:hypothetical protein [Acidimicrobiia bacterium]
MSRPWRSKLAALVVLFFLGTFAGQAQHLLDALRGRIDRGASVINQVRDTVTTIDRAVTDTADQLRAQVADLQAKLAAGTATPAQIDQLQALVARLRGMPGPPGSQGPTGATGAAGPPGPVGTGTPPLAGTGGTTTTTRPTPTSTTSRPGPPTTTTTTRTPTTTTTTRCAVGLGQLLKIGC